MSFLHESLLASMKLYLTRAGYSLNIKLHSIVRVCDHASASNFCMIFAFGLHIYCEDRAPSDDNSVVLKVYVLPVITYTVDN